MVPDARCRDLAVRCLSHRTGSGSRATPVAVRGPSRLLWALLAALVVLASSTEARALSDAAIAEGFLATVFGTEARPGEPTYVRKFVGPVEYSLISTSRVDRRPAIRTFAARLDSIVPNLALREAANPATARLHIYLVDRADFVATIRATAWAGTDTDFLERNDCAAVLAARPDGILQSLVFLAADDGEAAFRHCMIEELVQSLGPVNDSDALPGSILNDSSRANVFARLDWFILSILYDERIRPGMRAGDVRPLLPAIIGHVRMQLPPDLLAPSLP